MACRFFWLKAPQFYFSDVTAFYAETLIDLFRFVGYFLSGVAYLWFTGAFFLALLGEGLASCR